MRAGIRAGLWPAVATLAIGVSFGAVGQPVVGTAAAIAMSFIVYAGAAQFAAVGTLAAGGSVGAAVVAGLLMNARFLPMGIAAAPAFRGGRLRRAAEGQTVIDASFALAVDRDGRVDRGLLIGATLPQAVAWWAGTIAGAAAGSRLDVRALGLDAMFPAFFLALLVPELRDPRRRGVAAIAALMAATLLPLTPAGVPVVAATGVALLGLRRPPSPPVDAAGTP